MYDRIRNVPYIKNIRKFFRFFDTLPPVQISDWSILVNPRNLPYYVSFRATPFPPPGADVLYVWPRRREEGREREHHRQTSPVLAWRQSLIASFLPSISFSGMMLWRMLGRNYAWSSFSHSGLKVVQKKLLFFDFNTYCKNMEFAYTVESIL